MAFTMITLDAGDGYRLADGSVPRARIVATPYVSMTNGVVTVNQPVMIPLDSAGVATKSIAATTDTATLPVGNAYIFRVEVDGVTVQQFIAALPHNTGSTVQLSVLAPLATPPDLAAAGSYTDEQVRDVVGATLVQGANVTITPNDGANTITIAAATSGASGIPASTVDAKGDLIAGTANDTVARLAVGADGLALVAAAGQTTGLQWATPAPASHNHAATEITSGTVATARLGSGTANSTTFLRGDQTYAVPAGGAGGYATVQDEGAGLTQRAVLNFAGAGVTTTDDAGNSRTLVTIPGGGGSASGVVFSADTSGATNVSAALVTQATTAAGSGLPLIVPPGNYLISSTATLPANLTMWAPSGARFFGAVAASALLSVGTNTTIAGVTLENTSEPDGNAASIQASAKNVIFDDCTVIAPSIGIHANTAGIENLQVRNCRFQDTYFGILTNTGANDIQGVLVEGCHFSNVLGDAIEFNHPSGSAPTCRGFRVVGNNIAGANTTGGTTSTGFGVGVAGCADVTIIGNTIHGVLREGIHVEDGCQNVVISGNTVRQIPASGTNNGGIWIYGVGTDNVIVTNNTITDIAGIGIELVYSGGADLVAFVNVSGNIIRGCTSHGIFAGANDAAGGMWIASNNVISECLEYGIAFVGTFDKGTIQGNIIDACDVGIGCGEFSKMRVVRDNVITGSTTVDIDGFNQGIHLDGRVCRPSGTAAGTTMTLPMMRIGTRAEGTLAIALYSDTGPRWIDSLWRLRWTGAALLATRVAAGNQTVDDTGLSVVNGVLSVALSGVVNGVVMAGTVTFAGLLNENSSTLTGTVAGSAFATD